MPTTDKRHKGHPLRDHTERVHKLVAGLSLMAHSVDVKDSVRLIECADVLVEAHATDDGERVLEALLRARGAVYTLFGRRAISEQVRAEYVHFADALARDIEVTLSRSTPPVIMRDEDRLTLAPVLGGDVEARTVAGPVADSETLETPSEALVAAAIEEMPPTEPVPSRVIATPVQVPSQPEDVRTPEIVPAPQVPFVHTRVAVQKMAPVPAPRIALQPAPRPAGPKPVTRPHTAVPTGGTRSEKIISILRTRGKLGIKDISTHFNGVSEKTIQRDLISLIVSRKIRREGDRRWALYAAV